MPMTMPTTMPSTLPASVPESIAVILESSPTVWLGQIALVIVTAVYATLTFFILRQVKRQADAIVERDKHMLERPILRIIREIDDNMSRTGRLRAMLSKDGSPDLHLLWEIGAELKTVAFVTKAYAAITRNNFLVDGPYDPREKEEARLEAFQALKVAWYAVENDPALKEFVRLVSPKRSGGKSE